MRALPIIAAGLVLVSCADDRSVIRYRDSLGRPLTQDELLNVDDDVELRDGAIVRKPRPEPAYSGRVHRGSA